MSACSMLTCTCIAQLGIISDQSLIRTPESSVRTPVVCPLSTICGLGSDKQYNTCRNCVTYAKDYAPRKDIF